MSFLHLAFWPPVSLKLSATLLVFTRFFLSLSFLIGGERGSINTNHLIIKKCHFSAFQMRKKKKAKWGEEKRALLGRFFNWPLFFFSV